MKKLIALSVLGAALAVAGPVSAQTVETTNFITSPTNFNGFEGLGAITGVDGVTAYAEDGISVEYIGSLSGIWSYSNIPAPEGDYSWYPDGGGTGYTRITFADTTQIQFLAGSGFFNPPVTLAYELLLDGTTIASGIAGPLPTYTGNGADFVYYGFSGALFDEVHLQGVGGSPTGFDPSAFDALAIDAVTLGGGTVPEPATWALMILGFGAVGGAMRRRSVKVAYA